MSRPKRVTPEIAQAIREAYAIPGVRYTDLEYRFGFTAPVIARIVHPKRYWQQRLNQAKRELAKLKAQEQERAAQEVQ